MKKVKKLTKLTIFWIVAGAIIGSILLVALGFEIAFLIADKIEVWSPDYDKVAISEILDKDELSDEDYDILYAQTGLTKIGIDRALSHGTAGKQKILDVQNEYFGEHTVFNDKFAPFVCTDRLDGNKKITNIYLENGDIVVTSSTHISGFRIGHSGLVTNGPLGSVLQAMAYGTPTFVGKIGDFTSRVNFMILSPKADAKTRKDVVDFALENYKGVAYSGVIGIFSPKDTTEKTQCAHMIWQSYKNFGIDLDYNGGLLITPRDIANSPEVELVQVFGFDPVNLWK